MSRTVHHDYATGDLIEHPQAYQYSAYLGADWLRAWVAQRQDVLRDLPVAALPPVPSDQPLAVLVDTEHEGCATLAQLDAMLGAVRVGALERARAYALLAPWVKRFEVGKRLHAAYGPRLRPLDPADFRGLAPYLRYAELMECAWSHWAEWPYLNVLLKVMDSLIGSRARLTPKEGTILAWLIEREVGHMVRLMTRQGFAL